VRIIRAYEGRCGSWWWCLVVDVVVGTDVGSDVDVEAEGRGEEVMAWACPDDDDWKPQEEGSERYVS
jgi:hypothetical protein